MLGYYHSKAVFSVYIKVGGGLIFFNACFNFHTWTNNTFIIKYIIKYSALAG